MRKYVPDALLGRLPFCSTALLSNNVPWSSLSLSEGASSAGGHVLRLSKALIEV